MSETIILKNHIKAHLEASNISFDELAKRIEASPSSLFNWSEGTSITLNAKNLNSLVLLSEEIEVDLPFLLFPIETAKRYRSAQKFNEIANPILQHLWSDITKEIRVIIKNEVQAKGQ
jgi:hypothetical protein